LDNSVEDRPKKRKREDASGMKGGIKFENRILKIPLDEVYDQRTKIRSMIMDIKSNIYKIDK